MTHLLSEEAHPDRWSGWAFASLFIMNKTRIENRIEKIETELYSLDIRMDQAFTHKEVKELKKKYQKLSKSKDKLEKKLSNG